MSYTNEILLIDTCSYFRLAKEIHPLLNNPFGKTNKIILISRKLEFEYSLNSRLKNKFPWFITQDYVKNRSNVVSLTQNNIDDIDELMKYLKFCANENNFTVSDVDVYNIAVSSVLDITLISDDVILCELAAEFQVKTLKSLEVLKEMLDCGFITKDKVVSIVEYWINLPDKPYDLKSDLHRLFKLRLHNNKVF